MHYMYIVPGAYEPPEGRKECPTPHYSVERRLNLNGRYTSLIWTYFQVGRKCCFHSQRATLHPRVRVVPLAYGAGSKRITRVSQFTTVKQERERKIERPGKRKALYTRLYFPRGFTSRKWLSCAAICGVRDTAYFRHCASSSLGLYAASWLAAFRAFRSHVLFFLVHRCELRTGLTTCTRVPGAKVHVITLEARSRHSTPLFRELTRRARLREEA